MYLKSFKGSPFNFNEFKKIKIVAQTLLNHIDVIIHNQDTNNINLFVENLFRTFVVMD